MLAALLASNRFSSVLDTPTLLHNFGPWVTLAIAVIIFIESGVLFPFLPGDSLLVTAAILRQDLGLNAGVLCLIAITAAILGDQVGFMLGHKFGAGLFKDDARVLKTEHLRKAEDFFAKYGPAALVLGRFVPIVRTYVPVAAGTAGMPYRRFIGWNILGAISWVVTMVLVGVFLGGIPGVAHNIDIIMIIIVAISVIPVLVGWLRRRKAPATAPTTSLSDAPVHS